MKKPGKPESSRGTKKPRGTRAAPPRRKKAPAAARRNSKETQFSSGALAAVDAVCAAMPQGVFVKDAGHRWLLVNDTLCELTGLPKGKVLGQTDYDYWSREYADVRWTEDDQALARPGHIDRYVGEFEINGQHRWLARSKSAVTLPTGERILVGTVTDFTSIHEADARLRESEARARAAFDYVAVGMAECALDGHWLRVNAALTRMLGYGSPQELLDVPWEKVTHPDDTAAGAALLRKIERGEIDRYMRERRYLHKDGSDVWVSLSVAGVRDAKGKVNYCVETCEDITPRKRAEQALVQSETRFRATFEEAAVGMAHMDLQGAWLRVNRKLAEILGYSIPELLKLSCGDTTHPDDLESYFNALACFGAGEFETLKAEKRYIRKDGQVIWAAMNVALVRDTGGRPDYLIVNVEDISERRKIEAEREAARRREAQLAQFGLIVERSSNEVYIFDAQSLKFIHVNAGARKNIGYSIDELREMTALDIKPEYGHARFLELVGPLKRAEKDQILFETVHRRKDGSEYPVEVRLQLSSAGDTSAFVAIINDITRRRRAEQALRDSEERFRQLAENVKDVFWVSSADGSEVQYVSPAFESVWGHPVAALDEKPQLWFDAIVPEYREAVADAVRRAAEEGRSLEVEYRIIRADGSQRWIRDQVHPVRDAAGAIVRLVGAAEDITDHKRDEARVEASLREKEVLLKEVYHRVKNNLQVVSSLLEMQGRGLRDETLREVLADSVRRVKSMALVHEQLYHSRDLAQIDFGDYAKSLVENLVYSHLAVQRGIRVEVDVQNVHLGIETAIPCGLIINELVSNAIKHAFPGGSGGRVRLAFRAREAGGWLMEVSDDGVGPPEGFDPQNCPTLGMRLVSALCTQIAGSLSVESAAPGARFSIAFR